MEELITAIPTGISAFIATNLDDLVILTLWFSQVNQNFRSWHVVVGQFLGFGILVIGSIPGFFGSLILPERWIGLLGLIPIAIGLNNWLNQEKDDLEQNQAIEDLKPSSLTNFLSPQTYGVAAVTVANGSDNISIYVPIFANSNIVQLLIIIGVFFCLVGVWCYASYKLTKQDTIANNLSIYGNQLVPFILVGIGAYVILESQALHPLALLMCSLCLIGILKKYRPSTDVK